MGGGGTGHLAGHQGWRRDPGLKEDPREQKGAPGKDPPAGKGEMLRTAERVTLSTQGPGREPLRASGSRGSCSCPDRSPKGLAGR